VSASGRDDAPGPVQALLPVPLPPAQATHGGGLSFSAQGVSDPKRPAEVITWDQVSHVRPAPRGMAIEATDGRALVTRDGSEDEVVVSALVPLLTAFFG